MRSEESYRGSRSAWGRTLWIVWGLLISLIVVGLAIHRHRAIDGDFADTNQLIYAGGLLTWLLTVIVAFLSSGRLWGLLALLLPALGGIGFFTVFRLERLDGELRPQFAWRWSPRPLLPSVSQNDKLPTEPTDSRYQSRETDSPQFLGPSRNATWPDCKLDSDWDRSPPTILWKQSIGEGWASFAVLGDVGVTMEQRDSEEWVSAYDVNNGKLLWNYVIPGGYASPIAGNGPRSTPLIHQHRVFACSAVSQFVCLDLATGQQIWTHNLNELVGSDQAAMEKEVNWGRSGSAVIHDNSVVVPVGGTSAQKESLFAFECNSGVELWRSGGEQISYSSPAILELGGMQQMVYVSASSVSGFEPATGELLWRVEIDGLLPAPNVAQPLRVDDQHVFFSKGYGIGSKMLRVVPDQSADGKADGKSWKAQLVSENQSNLRTKFTNPVIHQGHAYGLSDGILECIELGSLTRKWKRGRYHHGQLLLLGEKLLVFAEDGRLVLISVDPEQHQELAQFPVLGNVCWNLPTLSGNRLLVRNATEAACVQLGIQ